MKHQHKHQHNETYFTVTVPRDRRGYEVVKRIVGSSIAETCLAAGGRKEGDVVEEMIGRSGEVQSVTYKTASSRAPIWPKLKKLTYPHEIASFMSKWGPIDHRPSMQAKYVTSVETLLPQFAGLKHLARYVESNDREGFLEALKDRTIFHGTLKADPHSGHIFGEVTNLALFLVLEMWMDFGGDRPSRGGIKTCAWCNRAFSAGGRRKSTTLRADAVYCSKSCRNTASRARVRSRVVAAIGP